MADANGTDHLDPRQAKILTGVTVEMATLRGAIPEFVDGHEVLKEREVNAVMLGLDPAPHPWMLDDVVTVDLAAELVASGVLAYGPQVIEAVLDKVELLLRAVAAKRGIEVPDLALPDGTLITPPGAST